MLPYNDTIFALFLQMSYCYIHKLLFDNFFSLLSFAKYYIPKFQNYQVTFFLSLENQILLGIKAYIFEMEHPSDMSRILKECTDIDVFTKESEYVMLRMRLAEGICISEFENEFGKDFFECFACVLRYAEQGFIELDGKSCSFTDKGFLISNAILSEMLDFS